ncbi:MAG: hypothetical protein ABI583_15685 [Betaproteobacteria bacterium]
MRNLDVTPSFYDVIANAPVLGTSCVQRNDLQFAALPVRFDQPTWIARLIENWAPGSSAFEVCFNQIVNGPDVDLQEAIAGKVTLTAH